MTPSAEDCRLRKHSVTLAGHRTSLSLEEAFWSALRDIARREGCSMTALIERIDGARSGNLSSAVRVTPCSASIARIRATVSPTTAARSSATLMACILRSS